MRIYLEQRFGKWAEKEGIDDRRLFQSAREAFAGQVDADLGAYLFKKRIARDGQGKSGGYRTILCFRKANEDRIFFLHGFAKGVKENISALELNALMKLGQGLLSATEEQLHGLLTQGYVKRIGEDADEAQE